MSIGCPGLKRSTFVVQLEWRCCCGPCGQAAKTSSSKKSDNKEFKLLRYVKDQGTTVFR